MFTRLSTALPKYKMFEPSGSKVLFKAIVAHFSCHLTLVSWHYGRPVLFLTRHHSCRRFTQQSGYTINRDKDTQADKAMNSVFTKSQVYSAMTCGDCKAKLNLKINKEP